MKILVYINSTHRQNTMKISEAMAEAAPLTIVDVRDASKYNVRDYDIVGFGSGIYAGKFSKKIINLIDKNLEDLQNVFLFSTSGTGKIKYNESLVTYLNANCKNVLGSFACKGLCKWFIFALVGGIGKGHPDADDFDAAQTFIGQVMEKYSSTNVSVNHSDS